MTIASFRRSLGVVALIAAAPVCAQEGSEAARTADDIIVTAEIAFRDRTDDANPVLSYGLEYFQRFEPVSVGEMLKRVPGVTFTSDVLEYDGVQMRGLPPGFTQVLINGRRAPGGEADRSFFVDRIPAELVERIEIVRAPRADQPSEGIAGTLNVVTKESASFEGAFIKGGLLINQDGNVRPSAAAAWAGNLSDSTTLWAALNYQERRNPKKKVSDRFARDDDGVLEFDNRELQKDTRDGRDISGNAELTHRFGDDGRLRLTGFFVDTNRDEDELSLEYDDEAALVSRETQAERISQQTYALVADAVIPLGAGELGLAAGWNGYREDTDTNVVAEDIEDDETEEENETLDIKDDEYSGTISYTYGKDLPIKVKVGVDLLDKKRTGANAVAEVGDDPEPLPSANFRIRERRYDPYARVTWEPSAAFSVDVGARYEITRRKTVGNEGGARYDAESLNPSLHLRYAPSASDQFRISLARTVRRPSYDLISPYAQEESPGDDDITRGNPALKNERAWGIDAGYERRLPGNGIFGANLFYRKVNDLIELVATGEEVIDDGEAIGSVYSPRNIGSGKVWGVEFDLSTPLAFAGLPDTGFFANYTYLDSSTRDPFTGEKRRFNNQPHHVYNIGFIQTVRAINASFGASLSGRSKATESNFDEVVKLSYTPDLEMFAEKRFGESFVLRGTVSNLLNRKKKEVFRKFDGDSLQEVLEARAAGELDEFERESEQSGRLFQVTLRAAFSARAICFVRRAR